MAPTLKVFRTHIGFDDMIVAAPSQKAALLAWGAGPHLFAQGFAEVTTDPALVKTALSQPGVVLRRQFGTKGEFAIQRGRLHAPLAAPVSAHKDRPAPALRTRTSNDRAKRRQEEAGRGEERQRGIQRREQQRLERERKEAARRAAETRRRLQGELAALAQERKEKLGGIDRREQALARERRELEQSFETRIVELRRRLKAL